MYVNAKMIPVEIIPGMGEEGNIGEKWRGRIQVWHVWYMVRTLVKAKMNPTQHNNKKIKQNSMTSDHAKKKKIGRSHNLTAS
jgi:hypothetical protein